MAGTSEGAKKNIKGKKQMDPSTFEKSGEKGRKTSGEEERRGNR